MKTRGSSRKSSGKTPKRKLSKKRTPKKRKMNAVSAKPTSTSPAPVEVINVDDDSIIDLVSSSFSVANSNDLSAKSDNELFFVDHGHTSDIEVPIFEPAYKKGKWEYIPPHLKESETNITNINNNEEKKDLSNGLTSLWDAFASSSKKADNDDWIVLDSSSSSDDDVIDLVSDDENSKQVNAKKHKRKRKGVCSGFLRSNQKWKHKKENTLPLPVAPADLRPIVIDGSNVGFGHGKNKFSARGLKICVDYFKKRGHKVKAFVPQFRRRHFQTSEHQFLDELEKEGILCYTPSRKVNGKLLVSYEDRFIVEYAANNGGVIVSKDNYRDILEENPEWAETINKRLLLYTWVDDTIMFPHDPLGRNGPCLNQFLSFNSKP